MAGTFLSSIFLLLVLVLASSGQYYNYYSYGDFDYGWCPFGIKGNCLCEEGTVDCTGQGLPSFPLGLPSHINTLILRGNQISSVEASHLNSLPSLKYLDLSSNNLKSLSADIFDSLTFLQQINISNNPWSCDCSLTWLRIWLQEAERKGIQVLNVSTTTCEQWPTTSMLNVSTAGFLPCAAPARAVRSVSSVPTPTGVDFNWTQVCSYWFHTEDCDKGPSQGGSCVYSHDNKKVAVVSYTNFTRHNDVGSCRSYCFANSYSYFAFQNFTTSCLCGQEEMTLACSDCTSINISSTALMLCGGSYMRVPSGLHVLIDVAISFSAPVTVGNSVTFTLTGHPSPVSSLTWDLGDGATLVTDKTSISHTYLYPGVFPLAVELCGAGVCKEVKVQVKVNNVQEVTELQCPGITEVSSKLEVNLTLPSTHSAEIKWSQTSPAGNVVVAGGCEDDWMLFAGKCIRLFTSNKDFTSAQSSCQTRGGNLLALDLLQQVHNLPLVLGLGKSDFAYIGAQFDGLVYRWTINTEATFLQVLSIDHSAGNCLLATASELVATNCTNRNRFICQKAHATCPRGQQFGSSGHCFLASSSALTWSAARQECQSQYGGSLAVLDNSSLTSSLVASVKFSSPAWIGLTAPDLLGHYVWMDGESVTWTNWDTSMSTSPWRASGVQWPCVALTSSGQWQTIDCDADLTYICEYTLNDKVELSMHVAGTADLQFNSSSVTTLTEDSSSLSGQPQLSLVMPGVWFANTGQVATVLLHMASHSPRNIITIQVLRPTCPSSQAVVRPGCNNNIFAECGRPSDASSCASLPSCSASQYPCLLSTTCKDLSSPCSCAGMSSVSADCSNTNVDPDITYTLVGQVQLDVPLSGATGSLISGTISSTINVQVGDVIGFQTTRSDLGFCHEDATSKWKQVAFSSTGTNWHALGDVVSLSSYTKLEKEVCLFSVIYTSPVPVSLPDSLAYVSAPVSYQFTAEVVGFPSATKSCTVDTMRAVGEIVMVHPTVMHATPTPYISVEAGTVQNIVAMVASGSSLQAMWLLSTGESSMVVLLSDCPTSLKGLAGCQRPASELAAPFIVFQHSFPSSSSHPVMLNVTVSNSLFVRALIVNVFSVVRIQDLILYHSSCTNHSACLPTLEVGVAHQFQTQKSAGDVDHYEFQVNGTAVSSSQPSALSHTFSSQGQYLIMVNASNTLENVQASLFVDAKVKANVQQQNLLLQSPSKVGKDVTLNVTASVSPNAELTITWNFGDSASDMNTAVYSRSRLVASVKHAFAAPGNYTVKVNLTDAFGITVSLQGQVIIQTAITHLTVSATPSLVATGNETTFSVQVHSTSSIYHEFGEITYTFSFGDQSADHVRTGPQTSQSAHHTYNTNGTFNASIEAKNQVSSITEYMNITVQSCPSKIRLQYDGPKNQSEQLTFTVDVSGGSDLTYIFDFADGSTPVTQSQPVVMYLYNTSSSYNASVIVQNSVCSLIDYYHVIVMDANTLVLRKIVHNLFAAVNDTVDFEADVVTLDMSIVTFTWTFGSYTGPPLTGTSKVQYQFSSVGDHLVQLKVGLRNQVFRNANTSVMVQQPVGPVIMQAPSLVSFSSMAQATVDFLASAASGSDVNYRWAINNTAITSTGANITQQMGTAGIFNISVIGYNEVSELGDWHIVLVQHIVENITVTCKNCFSERYVKTGANDWELHCTYLGTDVTTTWSSGQFTVKTDPVFKNHHYTSVGPYDISLNVSNRVSSEVVTFTLYVQDPVTTLNVTANTSVTKEGSTVQLMANHSQGTDVEFIWQCGVFAAQPTLSNTFQHHFPSWGLHICNVTAHNNVSSQQGSITVTVLQIITTLGIKNHVAGQTLYVPVNKLPGVEVDCNTEFSVIFTWNVLKAQAVLKTLMGDQLQYTFQNLGSYELNLTATNAISSQTINVQVEAMEEVTGLHLTANDTTVTFGSAVLLTANITTGTSPKFEWFIDGFPMTRMSGSIVPFILNAARQYIVVVNVSNPLNLLTDSVTILVQHPMTNLQIESTFNFTHPYIAQNQQYTFVGNVSQGSDPEFKWTILSPSNTPVEVLSKTLQQTFSQIGVYEIQLNVSNAVSQDNKSFAAYVEKEVARLSLTVSPSIVATRGSVYLGASVNSDATPVTFEWTVEGHTKMAESFMHSFQSAGLYLIKVEAYNNISSKEVTRTIKVQDTVSTLQILDCSKVRTSGVATKLQATAQGTNVSFFWLVQFPSKNQTASGSSINLTFPLAGFFPLTVWAENDVNQQNASCLLHVQDVISYVVVAIVHPPADYIFTNQNITFLVKGNNLQDAEYTWTFEGHFTANTSVTTFTTSFTAVQNITLVVEVKNAVSNTSDALTFSVQELKCNLPVVSRVGTPSRTIHRSHSVQFDVYINNRGCTEYFAMHTWQVFDVPDCTHSLPSASLTLDSSLDTAKPTLILPGRYLPTTTSQFCVRYTMGYQNTPVAEEVMYNLTHLASPLKAIISGGNQRVVDGTSGSLRLDASLSYNPDAPGAASASMLYQWDCQMVSGSGTCFQPVSNTNSVLTISSMSAGSYNVSLTVSLPGHTPETMYQIVVVLVQTPPVLSVGVECVSCMATRQYGISSSHHTALSAHCYNCTCPVEYSWSVREDKNPTPLSLGSDDTSTGTNAANFVVLRNTALKDNTAYQFTVTVTCQDGSGSSGNAFITLLPNLPPSSGTCTAIPTTIKPLTDTVTVNCSGWQDVDSTSTEATLLYEVKMERDGESYILYYGTRQRQSTFVAPWPGAGTGDTYLVVSVLDEAGARTEALRLPVTFLDTGVSGTNSSQELLAAAQTMLPTLMQQGDPVPLLQYALALTQLLNSASTNAATAGSRPSEDLMVQTLVRAAITVCVASGVPVSSLQQAQQLAYLLDLLTEFSAEYQTSGSHLLMIQSLESIVTRLNESVQPGLDREDFAFRSLLSSAYHLMEAVNMHQATTTSAAISVTTSSLTSAFPDLLSMTQDLASLLQSLDFTSSITEEHKKLVVTKAFSLAEDITSIVLESLVLGEARVTFTLGKLTMQGTRITVSSVGNYIEENGCRFILPKNLFSGLGSEDEVLKIVMMLNPNPFTWGYINQLSITSRVPTLSFKYPDGSDLAIKDLPNSIELVMFSSDSNNYTISNGSLIDSHHYDPQANFDLSTWNLGAGEKKKLVIDASMWMSGVSALHIQLRVHALPNATDQGGNIIYPSAAIRAYLGSGFEASETRYTEWKEITTSHMLTGVDHREYTFFISEQDFNKDTEYSITLVNKDTNNAVNISAGMYVSSCQYFEESGQAWSTSGCTVSDQSIPIATVCLCNHLTAFGGSSLAPISSITFTDLAELELGLNPVALATICTILALYIVVVIVCRYLDRADLRRISHVPLCGRDGVYKYHITVTTGRQFGAGTTAHIGIKLYGDQGKSEPRHLTKMAAFQRNSCDSFLIATDNELGRLHKVRVWHDNTGSSPCWYLTQIEVHDLQSGQHYIFPANTWLSLQVEDGKLQKEIRAAYPEELHSFSHVFTTALSNSWAERHMWLSVLNRPDHNRFTRVQRATCCVTLIYLYMFVNAMWYGLVKDQSDAADSLTWDVFGWEEVIIALVSVATVFPIALVFICIFKRSRSKADMFKQALRPQSAQTIEIDAMCDMSQYGGSLRTMTPNEDWMTLFERESTTESIPPISSQLRRTAPVNRSSRDITSRSSGSSFPGSRGKSTVQCIRRTQDLMWCQENILKSWPEKLPSFAEEEKEKTTPSKVSASSNSTNTSKASNAGSAKIPATSTSKSSITTKTTAATIAKSTTAATTSGKSAMKTTSFTTATSSPKTGHVKRIKSEPGNQAMGEAKSGAAGQTNSEAAAGAKASAKPVTVARKTTSFKTETEADSDDEFMQRLDEIDRELQKASAKSKASSKSSQGSSTPGLKKHSSSSQGAIDDLFDSDDEWTSEGLEAATKKRAEFNPRQDPHLDRRASLTSLMRLRALSMHVPSSAGGSTRTGSFLRRDSTFMRRDSTMHSFMMSEKSRTTLSAMFRERMQMLNPPTEERGCRLPWFCVYVGYTLCLCLSLISIIMVLLYGYNFGPAIALKWLLSLIITFFISAFVIEPLKVVLMSLFVAIVVKDAEKDMESDAIDVQPLVEANEQLKEVKFRPLGGFALLQAQDEGRRQQRLHCMLRQTIAYVMLTAVVLAIANVYFGSALYRSADHIENSFIYTDVSQNGSLAFYNVSSQEMFWNWTLNVLTPALYSHQLMTDEENPVLLGPARLRQIRSLLVNCVTTEVEDRRQCVGHLDFTEDRDSYSPGWNSTSGNASWVYFSAEQLNTHPKFGQSLLYGGGGYVQELGMSYSETLNILQQLWSSEWLDRRSRALFLEWTMYSAAGDLFSCVSLLLEFPVSGGALASHSISTQRLYIFSEGRIDPLYICQALLLIPTIYLLVHVVLVMVQQRTDFPRHPGSWLELIIVVLSLTSVGLYLACVVMATHTFNDFASSKSTFANFERVAYQQEVLRYLHAFLLFFIFLKIAGQVRFIRPLSVYIRTLGAACGKLTGATVIFLILLLTYTQAGYLFYGSFVSGYRSFQNSMVTLFGVVRGGADLSEAMEFQPVFSPFFFVSFYGLVYGLFVAFIIAILQDAFRLTRSQMCFKSSLEPQDYEMIEFMLKRFKLWAGITKPKPAFRRVKFEGLPSLPSRGSSSTASSWRPTSQRSTPTPDLIPSASNTDALDVLLPKWEKLLTLLGTVEAIEKEEQRQVKRVELAMDQWCSSHKQPQKKHPPNKKSGSPTGKPPVDPNSKFSRFRSNFQISNTDRAAKPSVLMTQDKPGMQSSSLASRPGTGPKVQDRPASDQGARAPAPLNRPASDGQKVQLSPASSSDSLPLSVTQRPGSDSQKERPTHPVGSMQTLPEPVSKDQRPNSDTHQSGPVKATSGAAVRKTVPESSGKGPGSAAPGFPVRQAAKVPVKGTSTNNSMKQAWNE